MKNNCIICGKETPRGELYCAPCLAASGSRRPANFWRFSIFFSALLLVLAGMLLWYGNRGPWEFSWGNFRGQATAMVNGEAISNAELQVRMQTGRRIFEQLYGVNFFSGKEGKARLAALKSEVLRRMVDERLIAQEARRLGISVSNERVDRELKRLAGDIYGSLENFQGRLAEEGISAERLRNHIRNVLTTEELMKIKCEPVKDTTQKGIYFDAWLAEAKKTAKVVLYDSSVPAQDIFPENPSCCDQDSASLAGGDRESKRPLER